MKRWTIVVALVWGGTGCGDDSGGGVADAASSVFDASIDTPDGMLNATDSGVFDANSSFDAQRMGDASVVFDATLPTPDATLPTPDATPPDAAPDGQPMVGFTAVVLDNFADDVTGFRFTVGAANIVVTDLGFWDQAVDGLGEAHDVGIYEVSSQTLVAVGTVPAGTAGMLDGEYRYVAVAPAQLLANTTYVALTYRATAIDAVAYNVQALVVNPLITYDSEVATNGTGQLSFVNTPFGNVNNGWFGPGFKAY